MARAFISYASGDTTFADLLQMKLEQQGIEVWMDSRELLAGEEWRDAIDSGLDQSDVVLVVVTPQSSASAYVTYEWAYALGKGIRVIPVLAEPAAVHPRLDALQYVDFTDPTRRPWSQLAGQVAAEQKPDGGPGSAVLADMTVDQFQELLAGALSLQAANKKGKQTGTVTEEISQVTRSMAGAVAASRRRAAPAGQKKSGHILWVDDQPDNNAYEREVFEALGFTFALALSTAEALEMMADGGFDAIISDMGRKEGPTEGYALLEAIRGRGLEIPFFIYTRSNSPEHKREATARGARGSTSSPTELLDLVASSLL